MKIKLSEQYKRIEVSFDYSPELVDVARSLPDRKYHDLRSGKFWSVPATPYHAKVVIDKFSPFRFAMAPAVKELAGKAEQLQAASEKVDGRTYKELYPFQSAGVDFLMKVRGRGILADDMGLGKTVQALTWLRLLGKEKAGRVLVVCPASVVYKWMAEINRWLGWYAAVIEKGKQPIPEGADVLVMSYAIATKKYLELKDLHPKTVIFDEFHYLKNNKAKRSASARFYAAEANHVIGLSGTPFLNRPIELYNFLNMIDPVGWKSFWSYASRYCGLTRTPFGVEYKGATNQEELAWRLKTVMVRRTKKEVLDQLPAISRTILPVTVSLKDYQAVVHQPNKTALQRLTAARQAVGKAKAGSAVEWAKDFLDSTEEKLVIYCHHLDVVEHIERELSSKYGVFTITGAVSQKERAHRIEMFQDTPRPRVMIITSAGGEGIDLYRASNILMVEREWSPLYEEQVESRLHRIGQHSPVTAWYLVAQGTVDEKLAYFVEQKREWFHTIVGGDKIETIVMDYLMEAL